MMMTGVAPPVKPGCKIDKNPRTAEKRLQAKMVRALIYNWRELNFISLSSNKLTNHVYCLLVDR